MRFEHRPSQLGWNKNLRSPCSSPDDALICRALSLKETYIATQMGLAGFGIFLSNHISLRKYRLQ